VTSQDASINTAVPVAVAFSGGGFRASLAGLGVVRLLAQAGLLERVKYVSSVSGGSWTGALLALNWDELETRGFTLEAADDLVVRPFVDRVTGTSLQRRLLLNMWRAFGPGKTRTDLLADAFDDWFGGGRCLADLPELERCRFTLNSTNLSTGKRYKFERDEVGDYTGVNGRRGKYITARSAVGTTGAGNGIRIRVADALGASAAIPGALAPQRLVKPYRGLYTEGAPPKLVDGAVYDNLAMEPFNHFRTSHPLIVSIDSGAPLHGAKIANDILSVLKRSQKVMQDQTALVRRRWMAESYSRWQRWRRDSPTEYREFSADIAGAEAAFKEWSRRKRELRAEGKSPELAGPRPPFPPDGAERGVTFALDSSTEGGLGAGISQKHYDHDSGPPEIPEWRDETPQDYIHAVADMPMSVKKLDPTLCRDVIYRSWWLTRAFLTTYHADVVPPVGGWQEWYQPTG
jgi:NTE family protein